MPSSSDDPYRWLSPIYDIFVEPALRDLRKSALAMAPIESGMRILDIACGTGLQMAESECQGCHSYGIDMSQSMLRQAVRKRHAASTLWIRADATHSPFPSESFDRISIVYALHEMPMGTRIRVLREAKRMLRKNGVFLLIDYDAQKEAWTGTNRLSWLGTHLVERIAGLHHYRNFRHFLRNGGLLPLVEQAGYHVQENRRFRLQKAHILLVHK